MSHHDFTDDEQGEPMAEREHYIEAARVRRETRTALAKAARQMRRRVAVTPEPRRTIVDRPVGVLETAGVLFSRSDIERMCTELVDEYVGVDL